jgi:drug/metabolite transporter (DMT)-like permease
MASADLGAFPISLAIRATQWYAYRVREQRERGAQHRLPVSLILAVSMTAAGVVYPVTDSALHHTSPIMIATLRAIVGGLLLTAMLPLMGSRLPRTRRLWLWAFAIGLGNTTLTQVGISVGTARAGAAVAAVLLNSSPFFVAVIAWFALAEPITRLRAAGLVIGFGGVLLVVLADPGNIAHGSRLAVGLALSLLGALGWAAGGVGMRVLTQRESDLDIVGITAAQFLAGGVPLIPLVLLAGGSTDWSGPSLFAQLAYLIIGGQLLVYVGFNAALSRWPSTRVYAWTFLVPVVAVVIEVVRGALPGASAMVGIALVIVGVAIVNHPRAEPSPVAGKSNSSPEEDLPTRPRTLPRN